MSKDTEILQAVWYDTEKAVIHDDTEIAIDKISKKTRKNIGEILDIYSEHMYRDGKRIYIKKERMEREEAHRMGALHTGAQIWIYNSKGQVLLQKRAITVKSSPGLLDTSVAWHIISGETIISGGLLELQQEIGLKAGPENLVHIGNYRRETKKTTVMWIQHNNEINKVFLLRYEGDLSTLRKQKSEVSELKFVALEQLEEDWNNPETLALYTSKGEQYRQMVLLNIKKALWRAE